MRLGFNDRVRSERFHWNSRLSLGDGHGSHHEGRPATSGVSGWNRWGWRWWEDSPPVEEVKGDDGGWDSESHLRSEYPGPVVPVCGACETATAASLSV